MKTLLIVLAWCLLWVLCWPLALAALLLWPVVWLLSLPFRLIGITFDALFALLRAVLLLPARSLAEAGPGVMGAWLPDALARLDARLGGQGQQPIDFCVVERFVAL